MPELLPYAEGAIEVEHDETSGKVRIVKAPNSTAISSAILDGEPDPLSAVLGTCVAYNLLEGWFVSFRDDHGRTITYRPGPSVVASDGARLYWAELVGDQQGDPV